MSKFSKTAISADKNSLNFIIPIIVLGFIGIIYVMSLKSDSNFANFVLIGVAAITTIYWVYILKKMTKDYKPKFVARETEAKNWVYDLIKEDKQFVFVAEVPGPDNKIMVRLIDGILYVRGSANFSKEVIIDGSNEMQITDFKYRNGVLTLKIN